MNRDLNSGAVDLLTSDTVDVDDEFLAVHLHHTALTTFVCAADDQYFIIATNGKRADLEENKRKTLVQDISVSQQHNAMYLMLGRYSPYTSLFHLDTLLTPCSLRSSLLNAELMIVRRRALGDEK